MKDKGDKKKDQELANQQAADRALWLQYMQKADQKSPLQEAWEKAQLDFLNWESGKSGPIDVMKAPSLGPALSLYQYAKQGQQGERMGQGAIQMGLNATDPGLAAKLAEQSKAKREQDAAGNLERAVAVRSAEAHGSALPLISLAQDKQLSLAGMAGGQRANSLGLWAGFRPRRSIWGDMMLQGMGNLQQGAQTAAFA